MAPDITPETSTGSGTPPPVPETTTSATPPPVQQQQQQQHPTGPARNEEGYTRQEWCRAGFPPEEWRDKPKAAGKNEGGSWGSPLHQR